MGSPQHRKIATLTPMDFNFHKMDAINLPSLPSSVYLPNEQDYGLWPDSAFPSAQTESETGQQSVQSYMSFSDGFDFSTYDETPLMSDLSGSSASWDGLPGPVAYDVAETRPNVTQDDTYR